METLKHLRSRREGGRADSTGALRLPFPRLCQPDGYKWEAVVSARVQGGVRWDCRWDPAAWVPVVLIRDRAQLTGNG